MLCCKPSVLLEQHHHCPYFVLLAEHCRQSPLNNPWLQWDCNSCKGHDKFSTPSFYSSTTEGIYWPEVTNHRQDYLILAQSLPVFQKWCIAQGNMLHILLRDDRKQEHNIIQAWRSTAAKPLYNYNSVKIDRTKLRCKLLGRRPFHDHGPARTVRTYDLHC